MREVKKKKSHNTGKSKITTMQEDQTKCSGKSKAGKTTSIRET